MASSARQAVACILLILCVAAYAQAQSSTAKDQTSSISGKVTFKGKAVAGVVVALVENNSGLARHRGTTDDEGNYRITNIPPGTYQAFPLTPALVTENTRSTRLLVIAAGEVISNINFAMVRGGVITGRITNTDGQPLIEESVSVAPVDFERDNYQYNSTPLQTDDRGIYRAFGLRPGKYIVSVGQQRGGMVSYVREVHQRTFYPSVTDTDKATEIEVSEGSEINDVDIVTSTPPSLFTASGRVIDGETGKPLPGIMFSIQKTEGDNSVSLPSVSGTNSNGEFKLPNLVPAKYTLYAATPENSDTRADPLSFDVVDRDLTGLEIKTKTGATLSGMVVLEGSLEKFITPAGGMYVFCWIEGPSQSASRHAKVDADGSFKLTALAAGNAHISFSFNDPREPRKFEFVRVEHNGVAQPGGVSIREREQVAGVRLVVKEIKGTGAIRGQLKVENGELPPSTRMTLWAVSVEETSPGTPKTSTPPTELDSRGRFFLERMSAGTYELRGLVIESNRRYEIPKQLVTVNDNAVTEVTVTVKLKP